MQTVIFLEANEPMTAAKLASLKGAQIVVDEHGVVIQNDGGLTGHTIDIEKFWNGLVTKPRKKRAKAEGSDP